MDDLARSTVAKAKKSERINRKLVENLKRKSPRNLDAIFNEAHHLIFNSTDCLKCANCCKVLGPRLNRTDIDRISAHLKLKSAAFIEKYLRIDEDGDHVFRNMPCPFLENNNACRIYEHRPKACRDYPHTNSRKMHQVLDITLKNCHVCPAVTDILAEVGKNLTGFQNS
jgi:Fe-S-cluster containining protein